jgi:hypothetical protein
VGTDFSVCLTSLIPLLEVCLIRPILPTRCRYRESFLHSITLCNTNPIGTTPLDEGSARRRHLYLYNAQHTQETSIHTLARCEPAVPPSEGSQTHAIDCTATGIGLLEVLNDKMEKKEAVVAH